MKIFAISFITYEMGFEIQRVKLSLHQLFNP